MNVPRSPGRALRTRFGLFLVAGAAGFLADATVFFTLLHGAGLDTIGCRVAASAVAVTVTWSINRTFAFRDGQRGPILAEYGRYVLASLAGAAANLAAFAAVAPHDAAAFHVPAYGIGTAVGLVVNFLLYDRVVFRARAL